MKIINNIEQLTERWESFLGLEGYSYIKAQDKFIKKCELGSTSISYSVRLASDNEHYTFHIRCGGRIECIEEKYAKHHPLLTKSDIKNKDTVSILYGNKPVFKKSISSPFLPSDTTKKYDDLVDCYRNDITPFFKKYTKLENIFSNLHIEDKSERIVSDPVSRYAILLSYAAIIDDSRLFQALREEVTNFTGKPFGSHHKPLLDSILKGISEENFE